jgi:glucose/arabinose dehydrogenase
MLQKKPAPTNSGSLTSVTALFKTLIYACLVMELAAPTPSMAKDTRSHQTLFDQPKIPLDLSERVKKIHLPPGFEINVYAVAPGARSLVLSPKNTLYVSNGGYAHTGSKVFAFRDQNGDGYGEQRYALIDDGDNPNGVAILEDDLYIAERWQISVLKNIENSLGTKTKRHVIYDKLPSPSLVPDSAKDAYGNAMHIEHHAWKYLAAGPDGWLYTAIGAPCNICAPDAPLGDKRFGPYHGKFDRILRIKPDGSAVEEFAQGVRNPMGLAWHPITKELWFTDNGRDLLGNDNPGDELNRAPSKGLHFGYPCFHATSASTSTPNQLLEDPEIKGPYCKKILHQKPAVALGPHVASLGLEFHHGRGVPEKYKHAIFIAEHGSWNRVGVKPSGYQVSVVLRDAKGNYQYEPFATGWLEPKGPGWESWGRPVDITIGPDGAILVSDDKAGLVYRISYRAPKRA